MKFKLFIITTFMMAFGFVSGVSAETANVSTEAGIATETNVQVKPISVTVNTQAKSTAISNLSLLSSATLRPGMKGDAVRSLQNILKEKGYYTLNIDGNYGPGTKAAVAQFQATQGLSADGIAGTRTFAKFAANAGAVVLPSANIGDITACTREYKPVCGQVTINCIKEPCPISEPKTFSNSCAAKASNAEVLYEGACDIIKPVSGDIDEETLSNSEKRELIAQLEAQIKRLQNYIKELEAQIKRIENAL